MYDSPAGDSGYEWVECRNVSGGPLDIRGWKFVDGLDNTKTLTLASGTTPIDNIPNCSFFVICEPADSSGNFLSKYASIDPSIPVLRTHSGMSLSNSGDTIKLVDGSGVTVIEVTYPDKGTDEPIIYDLNASGSWKKDEGNYGYGANWGNPGEINGAQTLPDCNDGAPTETPTTAPTDTPTYTPTETPTPTNTPYIPPAEGSPWPMFHGNPRHTGYTGYQGPEHNVLRWSYQAGAWISGSSAIDQDGNIYFGSWDGNIYMLDSSGAFLWSYKTGAEILSSPSIDGAGNIYIGSWDKKLYAITSTGSLAWTYDTGAKIYSEPTLDANGWIYFGSLDGIFYALTPTGALAWTYNTGEYIHGSPAIDDTGTVYTASSDNNVYALSSAGSLLWSYDTGADVTSSPAIDSTGRVIIGSVNDNLYVLGSDGSFVWSYTLAGNPGAAAAIDQDDNIYIGSQLGTMYALSSGGALLWSYQADSDTNAAPSIASNGIVYFTSYDTSCYALSLTGELIWKYTTGDEIGASPAIGLEKSLYVGSYDNTMYCFQDPTVTPTQTPTFTPTPTQTSVPPTFVPIQETVTPVPTEPSQPTATPEPPTPTATPTPALLEVIPDDFNAGQTFAVTLALNEPITQPFDVYNFVEVNGKKFTVYFNGAVKPGIIALFRNVPRFPKTLRKTITSRVRVPAKMSGKTITCYTIVMKTGVTIGSDLADLTPNTPGVIYLAKSQTTIR
jgi:outer membrane protein assembly factor BamB